MDSLILILENFLLLLILGNGNSEKVSYIFLKESCCYVSGNGNPEKIS